MLAFSFAPNLLPSLLPSVALVFGLIGFTLAVGTCVLRQLGCWRGGRILDPLMSITIAACMLTSQFGDQTLPSMMTNCSWIVIGMCGLGRVAFGSAAMSADA
ncbi:MAG: hypothetical protein MRY63_08085 [Neomegalonema sp.]|nr:hypothetical protein [Neomegalonema sp.]